MVLGSMRNRAFFLSVIAASALSACGDNKDRSVNTPPELTSGTFVEVDENHKSVFFTARARDADGHAVEFELAGEDAEYFVLDRHSGALRFVSPPNFEEPLDADKDNRYELTIIAKDSRGAEARQPLTVQVNNVAFAYEVLSPLPNTVLELERYSRLPIALWVEYDYPERFQVIVDGEIMNPASASRMTWSGSINLEKAGTDTELEVEMVFWRGEEVLERKFIPIRHKHVISDHSYLIYDGMNNQIVVPHPQRLEALVIDPTTGTSQKRYPWTGEAPQPRDFAYDPMTGSSLFTTPNTLFRLGSAVESVFPIRDNLDSEVVRQPKGSLVYDHLNSTLFAATAGRYAQIDSMTGFVQEIQYTSAFSTSDPVQLAYDDMGRRLFLAPQNGAGVEVLTPGETATSANVKLPGKRIGHLVYDNNLLYIAASETHQIGKLDLSTGNYSAFDGSGAELLSPTTLALDRARGILLTTSGARVISVDTNTGERTVVFDSSAGIGSSSNGFSGIWVAHDGARALATTKEPSRLVDMDLRRGVKTIRSYQPTLTKPGDYAVVHARFNTAGTQALVRYRQLNDNSAAQDIFELVALDDGASKRLSGQIIDGNFFRGSDQLLLLVREANKYALQFMDSQSGNVSEKRTLNVPANYSPITVRQIGNRIYMLGREGDEFSLSVLNDNQQLSTVSRFADSGSSTDDGAGIDALFDDSVLAISLPEQLPRFWHIAKNEEQDMNFAVFHGTDQPKDFYSVDDFNELYYMRTNSGLHVCWRFYCAILAN